MLPAAEPTDGTRPRVSAVLCTHRRPAVLRRAIASVVAQTMAEIELVVVDDASGDETAEVVRSFGDPRVRLVQNEVNLGLSASRNVGIAAARGDYIGFLDDDDEWLPEKSSKQAAALDAAPAEVGAAWCFQAWQLGDQERVKSIPLDGDVYRKLEKVDVAMMQALLVRRAVFDVVPPFDPELPMYDDYGWTLHLARAFRLVTVPEVLVRMHSTPGSMSQSPAKRIAAIDRLLDSHTALQHPSARSRWMLRRARDHAAVGDTAAWRADVRRARRTAPWSARPYVALAVGPDGHARLAALRNRAGRLARRLRAR